MCDLRVSPGYAAFMDAQEQREKREGARRLSSDVYCPSCDSRMKLRKGKYGPFYGCSNYPQCKQTVKY